ncbi:MAG: YlxR family protein [Clostridia bacterium]|nr:YlxR family protein [Clostridia bacterium]
MSKVVKKEKKLPVRQCLGCNEHKLKTELLRVVRSPEGEISLDFTGKKSGRGAYICRDVKCLRRAGKSLRIDRTLNCTVPPEVYDAMEKELEADGNK